MLTHRLRTALCFSALLLLPSLLHAAEAKHPNFGPNVLVFSPGMPTAEMQVAIDRIYAVQQRNEFGPERNAILLLPGEYRLDLPIGFYTEVTGLGATPDAVHITGNVRSEAAGRNDNATTTFWRAAEGFSVTPTGGGGVVAGDTTKQAPGEPWRSLAGNNTAVPPGTMLWAVSQAVAFRRMHVLGSMVLNQAKGWASGGWMSDSVVDGNVGSGTQQQWISRNSEWGSWSGHNWNMVFVGVPQAPAQSWPEPPYTTVAKTPVIREKPFLQVDKAGNWSVRVPALQHDTAGVTWHRGSTAGKSIPLAQFYIAHPERDTAATINAQLAQGKHLLLTPGIYLLNEPIKVTRPDTVVLGLGFATLKPVNGNAALETADVDGVIVAGLLVDAGEKQSALLMEVGPVGSRARHAADPISLHDVFFRVGGAGPGKALANLVVNASDTIIDHTWIWRADHGKRPASGMGSSVGWDQNLSETGLVVSGDNVTAYGLFVEHHQRFQVLWTGEGGRTYFYQSEIPYDPPTQAAYTSKPGTDGWAAYKVADAVKTHEAWGLGIYSVFRQPEVNLTRAIEAPVTPGVRFHDMITVALGRNGAIRNVINDVGGSTSMQPRVTPKVTGYPQ